MTKVVLGAGTGGLVAANLLASHGYKVTLIDKNTTHLFQPGMLWIAFKGHQPARYIRPLDRLVKPGVRLVKGEVAKVDLGDRRVTLKDGSTHSYDTLIIALGASLDYDQVPGHRELAARYGDFYGGPENAVRLWKSFSTLTQGTLLVAAADPLYKCPPAPHKAAFLAADTLRRRGLLGRVRVVLAVPFVHVYPSETIARILEPKLEEAGVETLTMFTVDTVDPEAGRAVSLEGEEVEFDVAAIIPPHRGPQAEITPGEVVDEDGFIRVDKHTLQVEGYDDAYAIGDCNNAPTSKTGVTAHLGAEVVVERMLGYDSRFTGRTNCPIVADGEATFVISSYKSPPIPVRFSKFKRFLEDVFIASYWSSLRDPEPPYSGRTSGRPTRRY